MSTHMFVCRHCGREVEMEHAFVSDGAPVECVEGHKGHVYIDADDEGFAFAGVSWNPLEPKAEFVVNDKDWP